MTDTLDSSFSHFIGFISKYHVLFGLFFSDFLEEYIGTDVSYSPFWLWVAAVGTMYLLFDIRWYRIWHAVRYSAVLGEW